MVATRPPLVLVPQYFGSLVFDRRTSRYMPFDCEATAFLRRLEREPVLGVVDETERENRDLLWDFYDYFYHKGFFTPDGFLAGEVLDIEPPDDHLAGPLAVHLEIMAACNLTCSHCFADPLPRHRDPLSLAEMDDLFAELSRMGAFRLGLTGGEPLLRKDLFDIIDAAIERGLHPCLTTNGLLITEAMAREFGKRQLMWLNVSLDGATATTNDAIRGSGTFEKVKQALGILGRHSRFTLAFTVTSHNCHEMAACAQLARDVGAHTAVFRPLYPVGVAARNLELMPTFTQYSTALQRLRDSVPAGTGRLHLTDELGEIRPSERANEERPFSPAAREAIRASVHTNNGCGAGNLVASITIRGDVNPCSFLGPAHEAGNIRRRPFAEIWHQSSGFRRIRSLSATSGCGDERFAGGCRARALVFGGDIDAVDPWHSEWRALTHEKPLSESQAALHPMSNLEVVR